MELLALRTGLGRVELEEPERAAVIQHLSTLAEGRTLTLLTGTKRPEISEAAVLAEVTGG